MANMTYSIVQNKIEQISQEISSFDTQMDNTPMKTVAFETLARNRNYKYRERMDYQTFVKRFNIENLEDN